MKSWLLDVNVLLGCCWTNHADHTALFVTLAKRHGLKLATLDIGLIAKPWAAGVAANPL